MAEQSVLLTAAQCRAILALVAEEDRLKAELQEIGESYQELGRLYAQAHQLPTKGARYNYRGEAKGQVRMIAITPDPPKESGQAVPDGPAEEVQNEQQTETA